MVMPQMQYEHTSPSLCQKPDQLCKRLERPMRNPAAIDYSIRRHAIQVGCGPHPACGTDPARHQRMFNPVRDRMVSLSAIGRSLKDHYDALAPPMPPHLAALVERLKMQR